MATNSPISEHSGDHVTENINYCEWTPHLVDQLGVRFFQEEVLKIILNRWCLLRLSSDSVTNVDNLVSACDFEFDYESIEDISERKGTYEKLRKKWSPDENQIMTMRLNEKEGIVNMQWLTVKLHEISFYLHSIIAERPQKAVSEWKYQALFEKLLQLFCFDTLSQPFIGTEKALIIGHTISSKADIICSRLDTRSESPIICVCEVYFFRDWLSVIRKLPVLPNTKYVYPVTIITGGKTSIRGERDIEYKVIVLQNLRVILCFIHSQTISEKDNASCPPKKKMKPDVAVTAMSRESDTTSSQSTASSRCNIGDHNLWAQHIGDLLVYLDKSFRYDGVLGITIDKTWVRFTYLEVPKTTMKKIKESPANRPGSLKVEEDERPLFFYSEPYNYLSREDRKIIFKALMLIKKMQSGYEKIQ